VPRQDVSSAVWLVELYLPSGLYKFAVRNVEVKPAGVVGGDFGGAHASADGASGENEFFGFGGFGSGAMG
jgi:hypothetical protein